VKRRAIDAQADHLRELVAQVEARLENEPVGARRDLLVHYRGKLEDSLLLAEVIARPQPKAVRRLVLPGQLDGKASS
jgi:hypothetical protein